MVLRWQSCLVVSVNLKTKSICILMACNPTAENVDIVIVIVYFFPFFNL